MIATNIKKYLDDNGIKQGWLAKKIGISPVRMSYYMNGKRKLKADMFIQICQTLSVSPETFAGNGGK